MHLEPQLNVLLVVTCSLQLGALATRVARRKRAALAMAGTNTALAFAFSLLIFAEFLQSHQTMELWLAVLLVLQVAVAIRDLTTPVVSRDLGFRFCKSGHTFPSAQTPWFLRESNGFFFDDLCPTAWLGPVFLIIVVA